MWRAYSGLDVWHPVEAEFPVQGTVPAQLVAALDWAILAPSGHNTQPWLFRQVADVIEVLADRSKRLAVVDPDDREMVMSCAAAVATLGITLRRFGWLAKVAWLPDDAGDVIARVGVAGRVAPTEAEIARFGAIIRRQTNRAAFRPDPVPVAILAKLSAIAEAHDAQLSVRVADDRVAVADLIARADRVQMADKAFRRELAACMRHNRTVQLDGLRGYSFGMGDLMSRFAALVVRRIDVGAGQAAKNQQLAVAAPALLIIETNTDTRQDWVRAGQALVNILLQLEVDGLAASHLNQPIEVPALRQALASLLGTGRVPQLLLRIGVPTQTQAHAPRVRAADLLA